MDFLQNIDGGTVLIIAVGLALLCGVGVVLLLFSQILGNVFELFSGLLGLFTGVAEGGPVSWCGCLVLFGACILCSVLGVVLWQTLGTCGTPNAVNFCRLFGG